MAARRRQGEALPVQGQTVPLGLGARLRHHRRLHGLRLKELAERVQCSESMLSKVETGKVNPSLILLRRLVDALGINIAALFDDDDIEAGGLVHRAGSRPLIAVDRLRRGAGPGVMLECLMPFAEGHFLEANIHIVAPGGSSSGAISHIGQEVGYVLEGALEITVDGETAVARQGDSFCFRSERPHGYRNTGTVVARVVWVNTPATF